MVLLVIVGSACKPTAFETEHEIAEAKNPRWLSIEIDTADKRHEYRESEYIQIVTSYTSSVLYQYRVDVAEGESRAAASDVLHISDGTKTDLYGGSIVCCDSRLVGLDDVDPYVSKSHVRFRMKPGKYQMYVTTNRVFPWQAGLKQYSPSDWETASNLLTLRILP